MGSGFNQLSFLLYVIFIIKENLSISTKVSSTTSNEAFNFQNEIAKANKYVKAMKNWTVWYAHNHDDVIKWKHFPRYWPFVREIHWSPVNSPHKGQWRGALMFSLICVWINGWVNSVEAGDLRRYRAHYDVTVKYRYYRFGIAMHYLHTYFNWNWLNQKYWKLSCLRLRQCLMTYLIILDRITGCQPGSQMLVTVRAQGCKHLVWAYTFL